PPLILHSDNGGEFVGNIIKETVKLWPSVKFIHGRPRYPQCQGSVEKANDILQTKLGSWMEETKRTDWSIGLPFVIWAMNNQVCNVTKSTPYELVFGQQPQADSQMISMLHRQNIVHEEDIPLENQPALINNYENDIIVIEDSDNLENNYADNLLDETFQDYKLYDVLSQTDTILEGLAQESTDSLFEESQQTSCSYTLIEDSDYESFMPIDNQSYSSRSSVDNHKLLRDKALQQENSPFIQIARMDEHIDWILEHKAHSFIDKILILIELKINLSD
ncbi:20473_t:CDS:2, partial [Gigaspora rosea]